MAETTIEWANYTFNPWRGCSKVSPGCAHCYAETLSKRNPKTLGEWGASGKRVIAAESYWKLPLKWDREAKEAGERRRVFCASLADVFEDRPELVLPRVRLYHLIHQTPNLDWLLLTKRPENWKRFCEDTPRSWSESTPKNAWFGASVENQDATKRIEDLLKIHAAVRFLSMEPLLGEVALVQRFNDGSHRDYLTGQFHNLKCKGMNGNPDFTVNTVDDNLPRIHWVIVGGESGHGARPMNPDWARSIRGHCSLAGVPFFFKQWGEWGPKPVRDWKTKDRHWFDYGDDRGIDVFRVGKKAAGRLLDGKEWNEFPSPKVTA